MSQPPHLNLLHTFFTPADSLPFLANLSYVVWQLSSHEDVGAGVGKSPWQNVQSAQTDFAHIRLKPRPSLPFLTNLLYCLLHFDLQTPVGAGAGASPAGSGAGASVGLGFSSSFLT
jgi:hypothetical protein